MEREEMVKWLRKRGYTDSFLVMLSEGQLQYYIYEEYG
jgi:hypothetical protein